MISAFFTEVQIPHGGGVFMSRFVCRPVVQELNGNKLKLNRAILNKRIVRLVAIVAIILSLDKFIRQYFIRKIV